ncbi:unnamed protein product [Euphydryas editha]|uniref:Uncharacterized protein n=1 Tax=Euphydryas editha TaxID=104508 RepID=A0AAU9TZA1_EUPED|nr:unnamed protein product [Euphydryas editha]
MNIYGIKDTDVKEGFKEKFNYSKAIIVEVSSVTIHLAISTAAVASPSVSSAALVLLGVDTGANLVAGSDAGGVSHNHQRESDEK